MERRVECVVQEDKEGDRVAHAHLAGERHHLDSRTAEDLVEEGARDQNEEGCARNTECHAGLVAKRGPVSCRVGEGTIGSVNLGVGEQSEAEKAVCVARAQSQPYVSRPPRAYKELCERHEGGFSRWKMRTVKDHEGGEDGGLVIQVVRGCRDTLRPYTCTTSDDKAGRRCGDQFLGDRHRGQRDGAELHSST